MGEIFRAFVVEELEHNIYQSKIMKRNTDDLVFGNVLIKVQYSALNYKDALSSRGHKGITRKYPHTPGIDASGIVVESLSPKFNTGEEVLVTGYDLGMNTDGGFGEYIRVPAEWVVKLPQNLNLRESMIYGTAGFSAGICIYKLIKEGIALETGKILVTGASGAVGSLAVAMLSKAGYYVIASTGKASARQFLIDLGAKEVICREEVIDLSTKPLLNKRWAGVIDTVGGKTLTSAIRATVPRGLVCCLGLVDSDKLEVSVYPFILRGVMLTGIDSAEQPMDIRLAIWEKIASEWKVPTLELIKKEVTLDNLKDEIELILNGGQIGKVIVNMSK